MFLGVVGLIDLLDIGYYSTANRVTSYESFDLAIDLTIPLTLLLAASIFYETRKPDERLIFIFFPFVMDVTRFNKGVMALLALSNIYMGLRRTLEFDKNSREIKVLSDPLYGVLAVYASLCGLSLLHWVALAPFGVT